MHSQVFHIWIKWNFFKKSIYNFTFQSFGNCNDEFFKTVSLTDTFDIFKQIAAEKCFLSTYNTFFNLQAKLFENIKLQKSRCKKRNKTKKAEICWEVLNKKRVICSSDHKTAKIFVMELEVKVQGCSFNKEQCSVGKLFFRVPNSDSFVSTWCYFIKKDIYIYIYIYKYNAII